MWLKVRRVTLREAPFHPAVLRSFEEAFSGQLASILYSAVDEELFQGTNLMQCVEESRGGDSFRFCDSLAEKRVFKILSRYPELRRLWSTQSRLFLAKMTEFAKRCREFVFEQEGAGGSVEGVAMDLSDAHQGNRSVIEVQVSSGKTWFYKPRSGRYEAAWYEFLQTINAAEFPSPFRHLRVICRPNHFWMEGVRRAPPKSRKDSLQFYFRAGALLYILHILRAVDCHRDNVFGVKADLAVIDCEAFLHPMLAPSRHAYEDDNPLLQTGFLPLPGWSQAPSISFLGAQVSEETFLSISQVRQQVISGFECMHCCLKSVVGRKAYRRLVLNLRRGKSRCIFRPTAHYHAILRESLSPNLLRHSDARDSYLFRRCRSGALSARIAHMEASALRNNDIPRFYRRPSPPRRLPNPAEMQAALRTIRAVFC